jgi:MPBQ/MSBQ methyltransferase
VMSTRAQIIELYDAWMASPLLREFYGYSDYFNLGYWRHDTQDQKEACDNLVDRLLEFIPRASRDVLEVACGLGGTTRRLLKRFAARDITAINISEAQLMRCRQNAPECAFATVDAAQLAFAAGSFDALVCIEAAFHFRTRLTFLEESYRVLRPGGVLVLSDGTFTTSGAVSHLRVPEENNVSLVDYERAYQKAGFRPPEIVIATEECWGGFRRGLSAWMKNKQLIGQLDERTVRGVEAALDQTPWQHYILVSAQKPG